MVGQRKLTVFLFPERTKWYKKLMAEHYRTQGIILRKEDRGEADRVFTIFTKEFGKLKLRAVSERKITSKLRGGLELFYLSELEFIQGKTHKTITDAFPLWSYPVLRADLGKLRVAHRFAEVADGILGGQERDEKIWDLLKETLLFLDRPSLGVRGLKILAYYFLWNLLERAGYGPSLGQIAAQDRKAAEFIEILLKSDTKALQGIKIDGINENLLQVISQEYLSRVLES